MSHITKKTLEHLAELARIARPYDFCYTSGNGQYNYAQKTARVV